MDIVNKIDDILQEYEYKAHKVNHGRRKSKASKLTGMAKLKYKQKLKKTAKKHKNDGAFKTKQKRYLKKHKKTQAYKQSQRKYKQFKK